MAEHNDKKSRFYSQFQDKTIGPPSSATGLTGDQLPESVIDIDDYDLITNQISLQESNDEVIDLVNKLGQATNLQSTSGVIPGTAIFGFAEITTAASTTIFTPPANTAWLLVGADKGGEYTGETNCVLRIACVDQNGTERAMEVAQQTGTNSPFTFSNGAPLLVTPPASVNVLTQGTGTGGDTDVRVYMVRVR